MLPIVPVVVMAATAAWYVRSLKAERAAWGPFRSLAIGMVLAALLAGALDAASSSRTNFTAYALQQILVGLAAPLFLLLAGFRLPRPATVNPAVAGILHAASLFGLYFTGFYGTSVRDPAVLQAVYLMWLGTGLLFWLPVITTRLGFWPRILYLLLAFPLWAVFGMALESETTTIAAGVTLSDLHLGAAILWVAGEALALLGALAVFVLWLDDDERRVRRHDQASEEAAARQLALWRAARDAAARAS
ncbi:MAG: cytochrome c oxidase assembly protein [Acidimicrobiales bacterium]|nr:cytochrome c oxidase assembly protein [Acidimicrobiales bacterium]